MQTARRWLPGILVVGVAAGLYFYRIGDTPLYIGGDEAHFAVQAQALSSTGRDLTGRFLPLFINLQGPLGENQTSTRWYQPLNFYLIALALQVLPLAEWSIRVTAVLVAVVNVALLYALGLRLFASRVYAAMAALLLVLTPAHLIFSRQALDYLLPVPFVLAWLLCWLRTLDTGSVRAAFASGLLLGIGMFSYLAAWVLMPCLLILGWIAQVVAGRRRFAAFVAAAVGFALPLALLLSWLWLHPEMARQTVARYSPVGTSQLTPLQRVKDFLNYNNVQEKISIYWDYFNPAFLFFSGGSNLTMATRKAGVFLLSLSVLLVCGAFDRLRHARAEPIGLVLLGGFFLAAIPPTLVDERYAIQRELVVLPFAALLATYGVAWLWRQPSRWVRTVTVLLLLSLPLHYAYFYRDYFSDYRIRSAYWFDPVDFRDVAEFVIGADAAGGVPVVYFAEDLDDVGARWRFYLTKSGRATLLQRTRFYRPDLFDGKAAAPGSLLVLYANDANVPGLVSSGQWSVATTVRDAATGSPTAVILRRNA